MICDLPTDVENEQKEVEKNLDDYFGDSDVEVHV